MLLIGVARLVAGLLAQTLGSKTKQRPTFYHNVIARPEQKCSKYWLLCQVQNMKVLLINADVSTIWAAFSDFRQHLEEVCGSANLVQIIIATRHILKSVLGS